MSDSERAITATLTISAPAARIARTRSMRSAGTPSKSCDDSTIRLPPVAAIRSAANAGLELDVDVFGALLQRALENPPPLGFGVLERAAFPLRPARHDDRRRPPGERGGHIRVGDRIEPQLDQIGAGERAASRRRRSSAIVGADATMTRSGLDIKKASSTGWAEEALLAPEYVGFRPRQLPLQSGRNTTIQNQTKNFPAR